MATIDILGVTHSYDLTAPTTSPYTLVFIHGWLLSRSYWQPLIERLASDYQCLSYDLRGFGYSQPNHSVVSQEQALSSRFSSKKLSNTRVEQSLASSDNASSLTSGNGLLASALLPGSKSGPERGKSRFYSDRSQSSVSTAESEVLCSSPSKYTPAAYAQDLAILLQQLNLSNVWLIGHSLGGSIALWGAAQASDRVQGVICLNAGGGIYIKEEFERFRAAGQQFLKIRPRWLRHLPLIDVLFTRASVARPIERCWGRKRVIDFVTAHPEAALGALLDSTTEIEVHKLPQVVSQLRQPVYFIAGAQDTIMEPKYVRHLASFHPMFESCGDNVVEVSNCGHMSMVEQPDTIVEHLRTILARYRC